MEENNSFSLGDILTKEGKPKSMGDDSSILVSDGQHDVKPEDLGEEALIKTLGIEEDENHFPDEEEHVEEKSKESKTLKLKENIKKPSLYERQLKTLADQQDSRIKALESALLEKNKKEELYRKTSQELYKYGALKDQESIDNQEYILNEQLKDAIHSHDIDGQVNINDKLRKLTALRAKLDSNIPSYLQDPQEEENYFGENYYQPPVEQEQMEVLNQWYESNPWLKVPHLKQKAADIMQELEEDLALDGKLELINTPQFFEEVSKRVKDQVKKSRMQNTGRYGTKPPSTVSSGAGAADLSPAVEGKEPWRRIKLSQDDIDSAIRVIGLREQQMGKPLTKEQKIERYQKALYDDAKKQQKYQDNFIRLW